jgi:erythromycin esterase
MSPYNVAVNEKTSEITDGVYRLHGSSDLDPLMDKIGDARVVLLGEASHGTHEFYSWRTALTKRLIKEKGFSFIAVEGDWPDCYQINRYVKHYTGTPFQAEDVLSKFRRWPTWLWANWETAALMEWVREYNKLLVPENRIGFYGLDVYSLWESMEIIINYLKKEDPSTAEMAMEALNCFEPFEENTQLYSKGLNLSPVCRQDLVKLLTDIQKKMNGFGHDYEALLNSEISSVVVSNANRYYDSMVSFNDESWNHRDNHMIEILTKIMNFYGQESKVIVWEHNSHIGDARASGLKEDQVLNVGQLARERFGEKNVVLVGLGTYEGTVLASRIWGGKMQEMKVPAAQKDSFENFLHDISPENKLVIFDDKNEHTFHRWFNNRAIGVVYRPETEKSGYLPSLINARYDAYIYIEKTGPLHPMNLKPDGMLIPDTYPFAI